MADPTQQVNSDLQSFLGQMSSRSSDLNKQDKEFSAAAKPIVQKIDDVEAHEGQLKPPTPLEIPPQPQPKQTDVWETFGSPAVWLASLGSMMTKAPMTHALNAAAGYINATKANDSAAAKSQMDIWKVNVDNAVKFHNFEMDAYKAALQKYGDEKSALTAEIQALTAAYKNPTASNIFMTRGSDEFIKYLKDSDKQVNDLTKAIPQIVANRALQDKIKANPNATPDEILGWTKEAQEAVKGRTASSKAAANKDYDIAKDEFNQAESNYRTNPTPANQKLVDDARKKLEGIGEEVKTGKAPDPAKADPAELIKQAKAAIADGAPKDKVKEKLKELGVEAPDDL